MLQTSWIAAIPLEVAKDAMPFSSLANDSSNAARVGFLVRV